MWTQERVLLILTIVVLTALLVSQLVRQTGFAVITAAVLVTVLVVRVVVPGIRMLQERKKPGRR